MKILAGLLLFTLSIATSSFAEEKTGGAEAILSIQRAIEIATRDVPGRVVEAELEKGVYEVKIVNQNNEWIKIKIDPKDGTILRKGKVVKVTAGFDR